MEDVQKQANIYYELVHNGTPPAEAFKQAFPNGIPTALDRAKVQAKAQQESAYGQIGGTLAGALGTAYLVKNVPGWLSTTAGKETAAAVGSTLSGGGAAASTGASVAAPEILGASKIAGGASGGTGAAGAGSIAASVVPVAGAVGGAALLAKGAKDLYEGDSGDPISRAQTAFTTGGISELARALGVGHKSTRDVARERTGELMGLGDAPEWQGYVQGMREQYNTAPPDPSKPFAGKYGTWDEYQQAGLEAGDLTGVYGNLKQGPLYGQLSDDQKLQYTQANIDANNYFSNKGDVLQRDEALGQKLLEQIMAGSYQAPQQQITATARPTPGNMPQLQGGTESPLVQALAQRSNTLSPGIGLDGRPIRY